MNQDYYISVEKRESNVIIAMGRGEYVDGLVKPYNLLPYDYNPNSGQSVGNLTQVKCMAMVLVYIAYYKVDNLDVKIEMVSNWMRKMEEDKCAKYLYILGEPDEYVDEITKHNTMVQS
jgi:hypothetical protein